MRNDLKEGMAFEFVYVVPQDKTVPHIFPEFPEGRQMPQVFATGFMVGLFEFACIKAINPHIDWPREQTVGIHINLSHEAATPPGFTITVKGVLQKIQGRKLFFDIEAFDGVDRISKGTHQRFIIDAAKFNETIKNKSLTI